MAILANLSNHLHPLHHILPSFHSENVHAQHFQHAYLRADDPHPYHVRGNAYIKLGDSDRGLDDLEKGGELEVLRYVNKIVSSSNIHVQSHEFTT